MRPIIFILVSYFIFVSCNNSGQQVPYEKVLLISLDTNVSCNNIKSEDLTSQKLQYECFVVDSLGRQMFKRTCEYELSGKEKELTVNFFQSFKDTLTGTLEGSSNGTMPVFRDAVLLFEKQTDKVPTRIYWISFPNSTIAMNGHSSYLIATLNALEPLAKIYIKHRLKSNDRTNWD